MASLLPPPSADSGRISQLLPSVKCSNCSQTVPIHELGDHVCVRPPPPAQSSSLSSFLPQRLQNLVSVQPPNDSKLSPPSSSLVSPSPRRSRGLSFGLKKSSPVTSTLPPPPVTPSPLRQQSIRPPPRQDSRDSVFSSTSSSRTRSPAPPQHIPPVPFPVQNSSLSVVASHDRAASNASSSNSAGSRPSFDLFRNRTPSNASQPRPSVESYRSRNLSSPGIGRPSLDSISRARTPSDTSRFHPPIPSPYNHYHIPNDSKYNRTLSPSNVQYPPFPAYSPPSVLQSVPTSKPEQSMHQQPLDMMQEPDTKIGGEAGMAGIGRRGFQAAARAAFLAATVGTDAQRGPESFEVGQTNDSSYTPPSVSPLSQSPLVPATTFSGLAATLPTGNSSQFGFPAIPDAAPLSRTPSPDERSETPLPSANPVHQNHNSSNDSDAFQNNRPLSPMSESDYGGLAYADSTDEDEHKIDDLPSRTSHIHFPSFSPESKTSSISMYSPILRAQNLSVASSSSNNAPRTSVKSTIGLNKTLETLLEDMPSTADDSPLPAHHTFLHSAPEPSSSFSNQPRTPPVRAHTTPTDSNFRRQDAQKPARSVTVSSSLKSKKPRLCASCDVIIQDGKWIPMDGGGVLCDKCWKNMYLPKCRRCNLPIEKQAVSSSDGQLKGKYHRDCFNCHSCHQPFPDKSFYVFDGKPFCAYHYHEANGSLCAAPTCGQPIEGPCAVSHSGEKYHPQHLICEYPRCTERLDEYWEMDGRMLCERHMKIEEEAAIRGGRDMLDDLMIDLGAVGDNFRNSARAMKRVTRFIDIGGLGGNGLK